MGAVRFTTSINISVNNENEKFIKIKSIKLSSFNPILYLVLCVFNNSTFRLLAVVRKVIEAIEKPTRIPSNEIILFI